MKAVRFLFQMSLGGAIWGSLLGVFLGGLLGGLVGAAMGNVSLGLDGALLAGAGGGVAGAIYGAVLALWYGDRDVSTEQVAVLRPIGREPEQEEVAIPSHPDGLRGDAGTVAQTTQRQQ